MSKKKSYLPINDDCKDFLGFSTCKDGLIILPKFRGVDNTHITMYLKCIEDKYLLDIHLKNDDTRKYDSIFNVKISKEYFELFREKYNKIKEEIFNLIKKDIVSEETVNISDLYCVDCSSSKLQIPSNLIDAKEFWKNVFSVKEIDVFLSTSCTNKDHKTFYDSKNKVILHKLSNYLFFIQRNSEERFNEIDKIYMKYLSKEIKIIDDVIEKINEHLRIKN